LCYHCSKTTDFNQEKSPASISCAESARKVEPITFANVTVDAPGFDQDQFSRAICRAFVDDLIVTQDQTGQHIVGPAGVNGGYVSSREQCTCKAGSCGQPCKHRARLIVYLDIREPALRRQWASARKLVAA
jgi:hypothetical protein